MDDYFLISARSKEVAHYAFVVRIKLRPFSIKCRHNVGIFRVPYGLHFCPEEIFRLMDKKSGRFRCIKRTRSKSKYGRLQINPKVLL